jgi:nitrogen regulatory protein PII
MVSSANLVMLFVFWKLLSYLLYLLAHNHGHAATLAGAYRTFTLLRVGDVAFLAGIVLAYHLYGTLEFPDLFAKATSTIVTLSPISGSEIQGTTAVTLLLLIRVIVAGEHRAFVTELLDRVNASGYTIIGNVSGKGHGGVHEAHLMFSEQESLKMIMTVVPEEKVEPILAGLRPLFDRHSGVMFVSDVAVSRQEGQRSLSDALRTALVFTTGTCLEWPPLRVPRRRHKVKGLRFERIGKNRYYNVVFHMGSSYVPVSDETLEELKAQSLLPVERFLELLIDRVGYSSYLKDQIRTELKSSGDPVTQITVLQGAIRDL